MRVRYTRCAFAEREAIFKYLYVQSPTGAGKVMAKLRQAIAALSSEPLGGHVTNMANVRVLFVGKYPYKIFYRIGQDAVEILHIRHRKSVV